MYDKPPKIFRPITLKEKHEFFIQLGKSYKNLVLDDNSTLFTEVINNEVCLKENRPALIVSSTSWTEDEDFSILLEALQGELQMTDQLYKLFIMQKDDPISQKLHQILIFILIT